MGILHEKIERQRKLNELTRFETLRRKMRYQQRLNDASLKRKLNKLIVSMEETLKRPETGQGTYRMYLALNRVTIDRASASESDTPELRALKEKALSLVLIFEFRAAVEAPRSDE